MPIHSDTLDSWDEDPEVQRRFEELKEEKDSDFDEENFWVDFDYDHEGYDPLDDREWDDATWD